MGRDEYKKSPLEEGSSNKSLLFGEAIPGSLTPFLYILVIHPSQISHTLGEVVADVFANDLPFVQNLSEAEKMKLLFKVNFHTYQPASLFSLATTERGYVLAIDKPTIERDTCKGKCETMEHK